MSSKVQNLALTAGSLIALSSGEYSDFGYLGAYVVLQNVTHDEFTRIAGEVREQARANDEANDISGKYDLPTGAQNMFQNALIRCGYLACIDLHEIHIGSYGSLEV